MGLGSRHNPLFMYIVHSKTDKISVDYFSLTSEMSHNQMHVLNFCVKHFVF